MSRLNINAEEYIPTTYSINEFSSIKNLVNNMFIKVINKTQYHRSIYKRKIIMKLNKKFIKEISNIENQIEEYYNIEKNDYYASYKKKSVIEKRIEEFEKNIKILNSDVNKMMNMSSYQFDMLILKTDNPTVHSVVENLFK